jgi:hypothetical protein
MLPGDMPERRPRDGWNKKPWDREEREKHHEEMPPPFEPFGMLFGPQDEYESITITIVIQRLNALFFGE